MLKNANHAADLCGVDTLRGKKTYLKGWFPEKPPILSSLCVIALNGIFVDWDDAFPNKVYNYLVNRLTPCVSRVFPVFFTGTVAVLNGQKGDQK